MIDKNTTTNNIKEISGDDGDEKVKENTMESKVYSSETIAYGMYIGQKWNKKIIHKISKP